MAESYVDYEMTGRNLGMCEHLDKEHFYRLTRGYFEAAVRNGSLYCAGDNREASGNMVAARLRPKEGDPVCQRNHEFGYLSRV